MNLTTVSLDELLNLVLEKKASDLHLTVGAPPQLRIDGDLVPAGEEKLDAANCKRLCSQKISQKQLESFETTQELDTAVQLGEKARFRVNLAFQQGSVSGAYRPIPTLIPSYESLGVPEVAMGLCNLPRGLVLVTGPTGSGKSTTLAAMIDSINRTRAEHIITIEDPIEFIHQSKKSLVAQREVEKDTPSFSSALKRILRQDPDVVLIGEMRDLETIGTAITVAETGHLVFATLHTNTAVTTINRIIDVFPSSQQGQIRTQLSFNLQGILSQQLLPRIGGGRCLAMEILIPTMALRNLIREDKVHQMYAAMQIGQDKTNMMTMTQSLVSLYKKNLITKENAMAFATEHEELKKALGM